MHNVILLQMRQLSRINRAKQDFLIYWTIQFTLFASKNNAQRRHRGAGPLLRERATRILHSAYCEQWHECASRSLSNRTILSISFPSYEWEPGKASAPV